MISYLKGTVAGIQKSGGNRVLTLEVNSCGYDLQIPARLTQLPATGELIQVFTHLQIQEEQPMLYGFERDLFRQLISEWHWRGKCDHSWTLELPDLVQAIISGNTQLLIQAPV